MYNQILKEHRAKSAATRKNVEALRAASLQSCEQVTAHLFAEVQAGVGAIYRNQRLLQTEASTLQAHTARFARSSEKWLALSSSLNTALKELGDVHNWSLTVQKDIRWIEREMKLTLEENNEKKIRIKEKRDNEMQQIKDTEDADRRRKEKERAEAAALATSPATALPHPVSEQHVHGADEELP